MKIFITGVSGYIGGSIAAKLVAGGHRVAGLVRTREKAAQLEARGIAPVLGGLGDRSILGDAGRAADAVINAADSDHLYAAEALVAALEGSGKRLLHTSGSSVVADRAAGEANECIFHEDTPFEPLPERLLRVAIDRIVLAAAQHGVHGIVFRPTMIYGRGRGLNPHSVQVPKLIALARKHGAALHVGPGRNRWSNVHIDDVVEAYLLALDADVPPGSLFYLENGEASWQAIAAAVSRLLGHGGATRVWPIDDAVKEMGSGAYTSFGSNSRVRATKARRMLGWSPRHDSLLAEIERGAYRDDLATFA
jgi:nucleoside-diphosphate-sugar epimerase